ncbi:response regulator [Paenibacillus sp. N4]|uniref:response regulator transcription factor n=1 Tax=Paenibacillus vietnamensis TaxID=2590547 RepID=UPI001CD0C957|nr:helix-turn-helix domain-containing protein [Paenibacillus vietnamensis]MCA0755760.1 response regulator [Paenibacillus vietnamensis]
MKVLVVDDEPLILQGLVKIVKEGAPAHTEVISGNNAYEALDLMKSFMPDVTVTDLNMPEKNGFELIEEAKRDELCQRFIILTGYDDFEFARKALRAGVVDYLLKPINKDEISVLLHRIAGELPCEADSDYCRHTAKLLGYIETNFTQDLSLDMLADYMNMHPNYISSLFKKETGATFIHYLNELRINEAKKLLAEHRQIPVNMIGSKVGYENRHYFNKVFKKYTGVTPGQYREG